MLEITRKNAGKYHEKCLKILGKMLENIEINARCFTSQASYKHNKVSYTKVEAEASYQNSDKEFSV